MSKNLRIAMAQINLTVGDIDTNLKKHLSLAAIARDQMQADMIVFPELSLTGYPPEDLLLRSAFLNEAENALKKLTAEIKNIYCVVGHPQRTAKGLCNSASIIYNGKILATGSKRHLPNYGVFDEKRYFIPGETTCVATIKDVPVAVLICEDLWFANPALDAAQHGAKLILSPNASPFEIDKHEKRVEALSKRAKASKLPIFYNNCVGAQDDLVFDGGSMVVNDKGEICQFAGFFNETLLLVEADCASTLPKIAKQEVTIPSEEEKIYGALVLGVRDYMQKNHFKNALLGLSGGIDSALTLCVAVDAIGHDHVQAIMMPSRFTSDMSKQDASLLAKNLGVSYQEISIEQPFQQFVDVLASHAGKNKLNIVDENIQSRCRGVILMALSNNTGALVLTAGNRSELATGYATLYGDMAGGFAVLKDIPKMLVYRLANYLNTKKAVIPQRILERPPTAELAFEQKDEDSLPPYPVLDRILELYLNLAKSPEEIIAEGFDSDVVNRVVRLIKINEYKRRQAPVGVRIQHTAFGRDRRYPVTNGFKG